MKLLVGEKNLPDKFQTLMGLSDGDVFLMKFLDMADWRTEIRNPLRLQQKTLL